MYVYCPEEFLGSKTQCNLEALIERLEEGGRTLLSQLFDVRYPYWKRNLRNNIRLVGELRYVGEVPVLVLFGLWPRGSHEYREFLDRRRDPDYQERVRSWVPDDRLQAWLAQRHEPGDPGSSRGDCFHFSSGFTTTPQSKRNGLSWDAKPASLG
jgi:hypothetical protein